MDEAAHGDGGNHPQQPQDDQDDSYRIEHINYPFVVEIEFPRSGKRESILERFRTGNRDLTLLSGAALREIIFRFKFQ
jgi:hypothetical protein